MGGYAQDKKDKKEKKDKNAPQEVPEPKRYKVEGGILHEVKVEKLSDTLTREVVVPDSVQNAVDSTALLSAREQRRLRKALLDSTGQRHSAIFRDSMPISRVCAISMVAPGFGQLYNEQYWKIPVAWATLGTSLYFGLQQNKKYKSYKGEYEAMQMRNASQEELNPVQAKMIRHNTYRQLLFAGALASYIYFIGDGAVNYQGYATSVKKATTLSTICPGAGQFYNRSYWKVPIVLGGFATMAYMIDWNNRGYKRFKLAYDLVTDNNDLTVDEFNGRYSADFLRNLRNNYRRNRDLCIILTGAFYLLNIIDAHVDAQLKDYDISDDLAVTVEPTLTNFYSMRQSQSNLVGFSIKFTF
ncbi:hypothetical protein INF32_05665 [Rikenellaceae bacterium DSM 108975]|nr:hypothetical protein [Gallalistipes aquisgranensis]